ncbi:hypothetical protein CRUP_010494 [Coryphaenoides rupestris]|nr:hypothetical protein CRUP_010494 [Coryphaenoides rupestris]
MSRLSAAQSYAPAAGEMEGREAGEGGDTAVADDRSSLVTHADNGAGHSRGNNVVLKRTRRYSLNEDGSELTIKNITKVDEGDYACIARNKAGDKDEETASELQDQVTLTCEASGEPTPAITWSFGPRSLDGNVVVRSDARVSSLTIKYVQFNDAGQYLCSARNPIGQDTQSMYLEGAVTVYTWEGNSANISCEVLAHPGASVLWFRDGQQLPNANSSNVKIYNTPGGSYLEINPESQNDFGSYNCTATNVIGSESKEFLMIQAENK